MSLFEKRNFPREEEEVGKEEKSTKKETIFDFSEAATTHGIYYALERGVLPLSNLFWVATFLSLLVVALYLTASAYIGWQDDPILTTVATTGHPISRLEFPAVTVCGQGTIKDTVDMALEEQIREFYKSEKGTDLDPELDQELLFETYGAEYLAYKFPGAIISPLAMVDQMTSRNPDSLVEAEVVVKGDDFDLCDFATGTGNSTDNGITDVADEDKCQSGLQLDPDYQMCYGGLGQMDYGRAKTVCAEKYGRPFDLDGSADQLSTVRDLFVNGSLQELSDIWFWTTVYKTNGDNFTTSYGEYLNETEAVSQGLLHLGSTAESNRKCFVMKYRPAPDNFRGKQTSCDYDTLHYSLCQADPAESLDCSGGVTGRKKRRRRRRRRRKRSNPSFDTKLDSLLNPSKKSDQQKSVEQARRMYRLSFQSLDMTAAYSSLFELLWYSQLPCFDVEHYTSTHRDHRSLLKQCHWKGQRIDCSAIFKTFPTDRGMCCTFNMHRADEIFQESRYLDLVTELQERDRNHSFGLDSPPSWYIDSGEPRPQQGVSKGLTLTLDAHTDQLASSSVYDDFQGFLAVINARDGYPVTSQGNIRIRPGHDTLVALSAVDVKADQEGIGGISLDKRQCLFPDEGDLKYHRKYSHSSCLLECQMAYVAAKMEEDGHDPCIPWYLPNVVGDGEEGGGMHMCDPWDAVEYRQTLEDMTEECPDCWPDCQTTAYSQTVTAVPFRRCDNKNLGISDMCDFSAAGTDDFANPPIFGSQIFEEYDGELPTYLKGQYETNIRKYSSDEDGEIFSNSAKSDTVYDAYSSDIARVHFYFETPTVFQYRRAERMTPVDFLSQVGGLMGLCLGISFASCVEVLYWCGYRLWFGCKKTGAVGERGAK